MLNSCCQGPSCNLFTSQILICSCSFRFATFYIMSQVHTWIKYLAFHSVISAHHDASSSSFVFWGCWLCLVDVIFPESLSDIALRRGLELRPKLNDTVWDRGQMVYVHQFSLSPSLI